MGGESGGSGGRRRRVRYSRHGSSCRGVGGEREGGPVLPAQIVVWGAGCGTGVRYSRHDCPMARIGGGVGLPGTGTVEKPSKFPIVL